MILWQYPEEVQRQLISAGLSRYGRIIGEMSSPNSRLYTLDDGVELKLIAKGIFVDPALSTAEQKQRINRALYEINSAHMVCHHYLIHRYTSLEIVFGIPFLIAPKRAGTLEDVIAEEKLSVVEALSIAVQIAHAIVYCNANGIIAHQDLKPANIYLDRWPSEFPIRWRIRVADFELANAFLILRRPYGSRPYMAPEQYNRVPDDVTASDFRNVDVFAMGVILYELLSGGRHPIGEETGLVWPFPDSSKSRKWERETPWKKWLKSGAQLVGDTSFIDEEILVVVRECLSVDPAARPPASLLEQHLATCLMKLDEDAHAYLSMNLALFDNVAIASKTEGWPHYDRLVENVNSAFTDG